MEKEGERERERERESRKFNVKSNAHFSSYFYTRIVFFCLRVYFLLLLCILLKEKSNTKNASDFSLERRSFACLTERERARRGTRRRRLNSYAHITHACASKAALAREHGGFV
jgi:hypothetical protein